MKNNNGEGTIYKDESRNTWVAEITWLDKAGEKHRKRWRDKKQAVVKQKLKEFKKQMLLSDNNIGGTSSVLFVEYADFWLTKILQPKLKPSSYMRKESTLRNQVYPYLGNYPIEEITDDDVRDMLKEFADKGLSYSTIKKAYEATNGVFKAYKEKYHLTRFYNPCESVTIPKSITGDNEDDDVKYFDKDQRQLIIKEVTRTYKNGKPVYRLGQIYILLMNTGMRIGELLALTWEDVDFENKTIKINKNVVRVKQKGGYVTINQNSTKTASGKRIIPINGAALNALIELKKLNGQYKWVTSTGTGTQTTYQNTIRMFHRILTRAGVMTDDVTYGIHTLRHTFASMLFQNGCNIKVVSDLLGHSNTKITENIYIHIIQEQRVKAIQSIDQFTD